MIKSLKDIKWKEFQICELFEIKNVYGKPLENYTDGNIPYITTSILNNGLVSCIAANGRCISSKNAISVDPINGKSFFHEYNFVGRGFSGASINLLYKNGLNKYIALFLCKTIENTAFKKASYGYLFNSDRLKKAKIMLPVNSKGEPDYKFMEEYIKEKEEKLKNQYAEHIKNLVNNLYKKVSSDKKWQDFSISKIFDIKAGKRLTKANMKQGDIPFIGATDSNNGITNFVLNENASTDNRVLGVNYNGSVVETFYHPYKCTFSDDVKRFSTKEVIGNKYIYLFLKNAILKQKCKYMYGYKFNESRMLKQKIMLPVNLKGEPDYQYMEDYMKYLEQKKLLEYLEYIK